ncbi:MAG: phosphatase PAP2 family protein [Calditrichia bacterium]|nr:phosphatase PAP2 family protein [Calditrichia bacterium]
MQILNSIDTQIFIILNQYIANPFLDVVMPVITNLNYWRIPIVIIWIYLMIKGGRRGRVAALLLIPVLALSDQMSSSVLKPLFGRVRPCHVLDHVRLLVGCGGKLSFPSSHATNISAVTILFGYFYRKGTIWFISIAVLVGFSRIYVGVHYPGDVLFGFMVGSSLSILIIFLYKKLTLKFPAIDYKNSDDAELTG